VPNCLVIGSMTSGICSTEIFSDAKMSILNNVYLG
jgi:hypothetical protein